MIPVLLAAVLVLGPAAESLAAAPDGCAPTATGTTCAWRFDTREEPGRLVWSFDLPVVERTYATITIVLDGVDGGWMYTLQRETDDGWRVFEEQAHTPTPSGSSVHRAVDTVLFEADPTQPHRLVFTPRLDGIQAAGMTVNDASVLTSGASSGAFTITYALEPLAEGVPPIRPAATREDPHVLAPVGDARRGGFDLSAVWFTDDRLGDGLLDLRVHVADIDDWDHDVGFSYIGYTVDFQVLGRSYRAWWRLSAYDPTPAIEDVWVECAIYELDDVGFRRAMTPLCAYDWTNSTVLASIPERFLGSPGDREPFTRMSAQSYSNRYQPGGWYSTATDGVEDSVSGERYAFAPGGPPVWDELNPRLAVPPEPVQPWYVAPLDRENVPDTLSVVGSALAAMTFLFGIVVVRRHRKQTRQLVARVDALVAQHEQSVRAGLLALGELESEFGRLLREGRITDAQYQVAAQRVTFAATRLALRRDLGLDDGAPGEEMTRVDVAVPGEAARPRP